MAKYGMSMTIPYGTDLFEVTGVEHCEWEDALERCGGDTNLMSWATYDVLMNNGYLVSQPTGERPITETETEELAKPKGRAKGRKPTTPRNPGATTEVNDGFDALTNYVAGETREPVWTQSRILSERDKLLSEREKITALKEKALNQRIVEQQLLERVRSQAPSSTWNSVENAVVFIVAGVLIIFLVMFGLVALLT